jgi:hypothetical protein
MGIEVLLGSRLHTREAVHIAENAYQVSPVGPDCSHNWSEQLPNFEDLLKVSGHGRTPDDRCLQLIESGVESSQYRFEGGHQRVEHHEQYEWAVVLVGPEESFIAMTCGSEPATRFIVNGDQK